MPRRSEAQKVADPFDLKAVRERLGLKQHAMADLLAAGQSSIARWEAEGSIPLIYRKFLHLYEQVNRGTNKRPDKSSASSSKAKKHASKVASASS